MRRSVRVLSFVLVALVAAVGAALWLVLDEDAPRDEPRVAPTGKTSDADAARVKRVGAPARVTGEVRRADDDTVVVGQRVVLEGVAGGKVETKTDARGAFEFAEVPHGGPYEVVVAEPGRAEARVAGLDLKRGEVRDVGTLWLAPAVPVVVEVRTSADEPVAGAKVEAFRVVELPEYADPTPPATSSAAAATDAEGLARFGALAMGDWTFTAAKAGFARGFGETRLARGEAGRRVLVFLTRARRVEGRVLSRAGAPVAGASVVALPRPLPATTAGAAAAVRAKADEAGRFILDGLAGGDVALWAARPGGRALQIVVVRPSGVPRIDLVLPDPTVVTGRVLDHDGEAPIPGAVVKALVNPDGGGEFAVETTADAEGRYRLDLPAGGELEEVSAEKAGYLPASDFGMWFKSVRVSAALPTVVDVVLFRGASLAGVVRGPDGPVAGARIDLETRGDRSKSVKTDREGRWLVDAFPAGPAVVWAWAPGFRQPDYPDDLRAALDGKTPCRWLVQIPAAGAATLDVTLEADAGSLAGLVEGPEGAPIEGAWIGVAGDEARKTATSGKDGAFRIDGICRDGSVNVRKDGFAPASEEFRLEPASGGEPLVVTLSPVPRVRGRVRAADGSPLEEAWVQVGVEPDASMLRLNPEWPWQDARREPLRAGGTFEVERPKAPFRVRAGAPGFATKQSAVLASAGEPPVVEIALEPALKIVGVARDDAGTPLARACVAAFRCFDERWPANAPNGGFAVVCVTDAAGRFEIAGLAPGCVGLDVRCDGVFPSVKVVRLPCEEEVVLEVRRSRWVAGRVVFEDGSPVEGAEIEGGDLPAITDATGAFKVGGWSDDEGHISVDPGRSCKVGFIPTRLDVVTGTTDLVVVVRRGRPLAGTVTLPDGRPARGAAVWATVSDERERAATTDADGRFEIVGLPPGRAVVSVRDDSGGDYEWRCSLDGFATGTTDVRLVLPPWSDFHGVLVDESDRPLAKTKVLHSPDHGDHGRFLDESQADESSTDDEGRFSFRGLASTAYRLRLPEASGVTLTDAPLVRPGGASARVVARSGASIAGVLADTDGKPIPLVRVYAAAEGETRTCLSREDGAFEVGGLVPDTTYRLWAEGTDVPRSVEREFLSGGRDVRLVAARGLAVAGRVVDKDGVPARNVSLKIRCPAERQIYVGPDGRFSATGIPAGEWWVSYGTGPLDQESAGKLRAGDLDATLRLTISLHPREEK